MNLKQIHTTLISGRFTVIIFIILVIVMRLITHPDLSNVSFWGALLLQVGIAIALLQVNYAYTIIRSRTMLPAIFYLLIIGAYPLLYTEWKGSLAAAGTLICLVFLFESYQKPDSQKNALNIGLVLSLCSLVCPPLLCLLPLFWYGFYRFQSLNFKTFFASILGVMTVSLFAFIWYVYIEKIESFVSVFSDYRYLFGLHSFSLSIQDIVVYSFVSILFFMSGINIFLSGLSEKIRTGTYLKFLYLMSVCLAILLVFQSEIKASWILLVYIPVTFMISHFFTISTRKITSWTLIVFILFFIGMYVWQVLFLL